MTMNMLTGEVNNILISRASAKGVGYLVANEQSVLKVHMLKVGKKDL